MGLSFLSGTNSVNFSFHRKGSFSPTDTKFPKRGTGRKSGQKSNDAPKIATIYIHNHYLNQILIDHLTYRFLNKITKVIYHNFVYGK